jgi:AraC-like DNA-binding protein
VSGEGAGTASHAPQATFSSDQSASPRAAFSRWQERCSALFEVLPTERFGADDFKVDVTSFHLGSMVLSKTSATGQRYARSPALIANSGVDHLVIQLLRRGGTRGRTGAKDYLTTPGDISILDLSQTMRTAAIDYSQIAMFVPRAALLPALPDIEALHGVVLRADHPRTRILADHLNSLAVNAPNLALADCKSVAEVTLGLFAACARPSVARNEFVETAVAQACVARIKAYIDTALADPDLDVDAVAQHFRLSRRSLYRLFAPAGGVAEFIRNRRLSHCFRVLEAPENAHRRVIDIAFDAGFTNEAAFSRAFRRRFGISPREARFEAEADRIDRRSGAIPGDWLDFDRWVRGLRV